jgi:phospholipase C
MSDLSRRGFVRGALSAASSLALPIVVRDNAAAAAAPAKLSDIDHFIILMQENRSFDHYFGTLSGVRGFDDARAPRLSSGRSVFYQPDPLNPDGFELPFHLDTATTSAQQLSDLSHEWSAQHESWNGGTMDNWLPAHRKADRFGHGPLTMGHFRRADIPFHYALADAFTICDGYHCSVLGPTYPNRLYHMTATIDPSGAGGGPVLNNNAVFGNIQYQWETYPERLQRAGISWQVYFDVVDDYLMNVLRYFPAYHNAAPNSPLFRQAMVGRPIAQFLNDLRTGNMPQVTWILGHADQTEHPSYMPAVGQDYIRRILTALWENPRVWARTAFILNYYENDGQFDHVPPPVPDAGTTGEFINGLPIGLGFRVPCIVVSPFTRGGYVCSDTFDHTSVLQLLEARFGVEVPNLTAWRRKTTGDLRSAFGFGEPPRLDVPNLPETAAGITTAELSLARFPAPVVPKIQSMPTQEPGTRPRRGKTV